MTIYRLLYWRDFIVAFNPVAFALSYTFMTDTFFTMAMIVSILFFLHAPEDRTGQRTWLSPWLRRSRRPLCRQLGLWQQ